MLNTENESTNLNKNNQEKSEIPDKIKEPLVILPNFTGLSNPVRTESPKTHTHA